MAASIRVLLVEDSPEDTEILLHALRRAGFDPQWERVDTEAEYLTRLHAGFDIILSDHSMPQFSGQRALQLLKQSGLEIPFISVSGTIGEEVAVEAMKHGVTDYLLKDNLTRLGPAVSRALEEFRLRKERRRLEEQARQSQKLEAVGQLAGGVAHDFNNILTVIQGYATLLEQGMMSNEEAAREINYAVERLSSLSRQLLSLSRKQPIQLRLLDLNTVVTEMTKLLRRSLGEMVTLVVGTADHLPHIRADQGMMEQILLNLSLNARDAMPEGGRLFISTSIATLSEDEAQTYPGAKVGPAVCLRIEDTGCGIPPEIRPRVFEPFFTTKDASKGTGLGLTTVQSIVKQHQGIIRLQSTPGEGTTFEIVLPANVEAAAAPAPSPLLSANNRGSETILVVDDEPTLRDMIHRALKLFGYQVLEAASGKKALALYEETEPPIDLLLTDMVMPDGINGQELAEQMRAKKPGLRVLYTSGHHIAAVSQGLVGQADVHFLQKPFTMQKLASAVRDCLKN